MKHFLLALACLILPSVCFGQTAFVDPDHHVKITTDLSTLDYNATRTITFDENGPTSEVNLPPDTGYIYIYNPQTRKGVIEFSRTLRYSPYLFDYSRLRCYEDCVPYGYRSR